MRSTLAFAALGFGAVVCLSSSHGREEAQKTSICTLYSQGRDYDGRRVTVTARLIVSTYTLQDQHCPEAHITVIVPRVPPAACQGAAPAPPLGCPGDKRKFIDGTFSGTFTASSARSRGQLRLEMANYYFITSHAGP